MQVERNTLCKFARAQWCAAGSVGVGSDCACAGDARGPTSPVCPRPPAPAGHPDQVSGHRSAARGRWVRNEAQPGGLLVKKLLTFVAAQPGGLQLGGHTTQAQEGHLSPHSATDPPTEVPRVPGHS